MILKISDRITNRKVDYFNNFSLNLRYDSVGSTFAFNFYYNPDNADHRQLVCVSHFHNATVEHNGELLLTGTILSEGFKSGSTKELVGFGGYSLPGVLEDCNIPPSLYPLQSDGLTLRQIAAKLIKPFGLGMVVDSSVASKMDQVFEKTTASETQSIKDYIVELATQKNIIVSHNERGNLFFTSAKPNQKPIFHFEKGLTGTTFDLSFSGQGLHSEISVIKQASSKGGNASEYTIKNPLVPIVYRPKVLTQTSGDDISVEEAAKNALAAELKNIKLVITTDRWEVNGKILKPNNIVSVINPDIYIFKKTNWFIESIDFAGDNKALTATLTCVLPEVYNGETPKNIFVSDHFKQNA